MNFNLQPSGIPRLRRAPSDGSEDVDGDTPFKPTIFVAGLAILMVFAVGWKLKDIMKRRMRLREDVTGAVPSSEEECIPRLWDVWVDRISRKQETYSLLEMQPLSVIPSQSITEFPAITGRPVRYASGANHNPMGSSSPLKSCPRSPRASESVTVHLRVSVIIAMPSPRSVSRGHFSASVGKPEDRYTRSRERSIPDILERGDFDFMIGVAHVPLV